VAADKTSAAELLDTPEKVLEACLDVWRSIPGAVLIDLTRHTLASSVRAYVAGKLEALRSRIPAQPERAQPAVTRESERAALVAEVGECCHGADPLCADGCLVESALAKRREQRAEAKHAAGSFRTEAGPTCPGCGLPAILGCDCTSAPQPQPPTVDPRIREMALGGAIGGLMQSAVVRGWPQPPDATLRNAARGVLRAGRAYMKYHHEKFYGGSNPPPGITMALDVLEEALAAPAAQPQDGLEAVRDALIAEVQSFTELPVGWKGALVGTIQRVCASQRSDAAPRTGGK
jgi:hypothetical protein